MRLPRWCWLYVGVLASSCGPPRYLATQLKQAEKDFQNHIGFYLYDPLTHKTIYDHQGDRYFTPASNTKILTLYASLLLLGDSVPALRYQQRGDSLIFWGTGDPGFLYEYTFESRRVYDFLKGHPSKLFFSSHNFHTEHFGPGWAWDDELYAYQVEKTPLPIYGNRVAVKRWGSKITWKPNVPDSSRLMRERIAKIVGREFKVPFYYSDELLASILSDTLKRQVNVVKHLLSKETKTFYAGVPDSLYKVMMQESDNFIAEQLLLVCANTISDTLKSEITIDFVKNKFLYDLEDKPVWVDGSGLSRYNLFTPRSLVRIWEKIYARVPRERLFSLLAIGGETGTLRNYYKAERPFIFGKTGTFSNNHSLSGFLVTKQGRTLIFSWMNNNFTTSTGEVRGRMESVLKRIYETY